MVIVAHCLRWACFEVVLRAGRSCSHERFGFGELLIQSFTVRRSLGDTSVGVGRERSAGLLREHVLVDGGDRDSHNVLATGEVEEGRDDKGEDDREDDLAEDEQHVYTASTDSNGHDESRYNGYTPGDQTTKKGLHAEIFQRRTERK